MSGQIILDSIMHKSRKYYRVTLIVPDNGIPIIEYHQANASKKSKKSIPFVDLLFADKKHDSNEKFALSIYTTDKTVTFSAQDETTMNEWLNKIRECHLDIYPEFKRYDAVFEANLLDKGLAKTMNIHGPYRIALCKESLDLIPLLTAPHLISANKQQATATAAPIATPTTTATINNNNHASTTHPHLFLRNETKLPNSTLMHLHSIITSTTTTIKPLNSSHTVIPQSTNQLPQTMRNHQRFRKRHPLLSSNIIELVLRSIRRCGHTDCNFYIESGRHSQIGEGDLWMALSKKATARQLHELLLATMKLASTTEDQYLYKAPRSRSGSSSENAHRLPQQSRSSLICLASDPQGATSAVATTHTITNATIDPTNRNISNTTNNNNNNNNNNIINSDEDSGYLPMA